MVAAFFFCHPVTEHSNDQLASCVRVHFFFFLMGSEIFLLVIFFFKKRVIQKPLGIYDLLISMELYKFFYKDLS